MLKMDLITTNYYYENVVSGLASSQGSRGGDLGGIVIYYNLLLFNAAATSAALILYVLYKLLADLILCFKNRVKMLVFDRPSTFPLTLVLLSNSPLYSLFLHFDTSCILLSSLGLSLAEYARYSPLLYFPLFALPDRALQSMLDPWSPG